MPTKTVSNATQLNAALASMSNGGTIYLKAGDYGNIAIRDLNPLKQITIVSADLNNQAHIGSINIMRSSNLSFTSLDVGRALTTTEPDYFSYVYVDRSTNISVGNSKIHGNLDGHPGNDGVGMSVFNSSNINVYNNSFDDLHKGATFSFSDTISVRSNHIEHLSEDAMDYAQVKNVQIVGNYMANFSEIKNHPDGIQFMTSGTTQSSENIVIRNNVVMQGAGLPMQGIFMRDELTTLPYKNVTIENNLIYTEQYNGIVVTHGEGITVRNNSTLSTPGDNVADRIWIANTTGAIISNNVADAFIFDNVQGSKTNNTDLLNTGSPERYFQNLGAGASATINDLLTTKGGYSPASFGNVTGGGPVSSALGKNLFNMMAAASETENGRTGAAVNKVAVDDSFLQHASVAPTYAAPSVVSLQHQMMFDHFHLA